MFGGVEQQERTHPVMLLVKDSGASTLMEDMDWGVLSDMLAGCWGPGALGREMSVSEKVWRMCGKGCGKGG